MEEPWNPWKVINWILIAYINLPKSLNKKNEQNKIRHDLNKPDFRRLNIAYSFSLIVDFASLYFSSRSCRALLVSSRSFYNQEMSEVIRNIFAKIMWNHMTETRKVPESFQVFHPTLHSKVVQHHKALLVQPIAGHRFCRNILISVISNITVCFHMLRQLTLSLASKSAPSRSIFSVMA